MPPPLPFKCEPIGVRLSPADRDAVQRFATQEDRALATQIRRIVSEWVRRQEEKEAESAEWKAKRG